MSEAETTILGTPAVPKPAPPEPQEARAALVHRLLDQIHAAEKHAKSVFDEMRANQEFVRTGRAADQSEDFYSANLAFRYVKQQTSALYARNPTVEAKRQHRMDFRIWDGEDVQALTQSAAIAAEAAVNPALAMDPRAQQAAALMEDYAQGMQRRQMLSRVGSTLAILFEHFMADQTPSFKGSMKRAVRRVITCGVAYVELAFQRAYEKRPDREQEIADITARLSHIERLMTAASVGDIDAGSAEAEELRLALEQLQAEPDVLVREGLVFHFPFATQIIIDPACTSLEGFAGADWVAKAIPLTSEKIKEVYGVDVAEQRERSAGTPWRSYRDDAKPDTQYLTVYVMWHRPTGLQYTLVDGFDDFLEPPRPPSVTVEQFVPVYPLTFNEIEDERCIYPVSDVSLLRAIQRTYNGSREALVLHRRASMPKWAATEQVPDEAIEALAAGEINQIIRIAGLATGQRVDDVLQQVKNFPIDPNVYETAQYLQDMNLVLGAQEATFGATSGATATETAIAQGARTSSTSSDINALDEFLSLLARDAGQILLQEMSASRVLEIVGPGAAWPDLSREDIVSELYLRIEAGSSGRPNKAEDLANFERLAPYLLQIPNINQVRIAREAIRRFDDNLDLMEYIEVGAPSIVATNAAMRPSTGDPATDPAQQSGEGADKTSDPQQRPGGPQAPMGNNRV